ncbi:MAG: hemolysin family protein [Candidatus Limivicinus sp.]|nr:hemolysin family protein [Candidatus Limivicinus sp.]MDY5083496.1 hemolysin family protein [Candidatus Limivicinus sp.]
MDDGSRLPWIIAALLLVCAAFFAVTETSMASASRSRIKASAERGDFRAKKTLYVLDNFDLAISTLLICTNIVHIAAASIVTLAVTRKWGVSAVSISTIITTVVVFFAGEMLPKSVAKKYSDTLALSCAPVLCFFMKLFAPLSKLLTWIGQAAAKLTPGDSQISVTEDELYDIIEDMTEEGSLDEDQGDLISSALQFGDVTVESVLTPRVDIVAININSSHAELLSLIKSTNHSRLPVYEGSIDNIIGVLQIRKYIKAYLRLGENLDIKPMLDEVLFVHQSTNIDELLPILSRRKLNIAVVTDNYGGTLGIVTVEDILEELVGEIWDEDDVIEEPMVEIGDGVYEVGADETVSDVFDQLGYEDPENDEELVNTLMGEWAYEKFDTIPKPGDSFRYHQVLVTVKDMNHNRIMKLTVALLPAEEEGGEAQ